MSTLKPGDKVQLTASTIKLAKPELKPFQGQILTIQSQPYVGRYTVEGSTQIFCDWMLEKAKTKKAG